MECKKKSKLLAVIVVFLVHGKISRGEYDDWCLDYVSKKCEMWKADGRCQLTNRRLQGMIRKLCMETCNYCEPPSPEVCYNENHEVSKYGCCWDGTNAATGPNGHGCPACENKESRRFCSMRKDLCFTPGNYRFLRENCPETCGYCRKAPSPCKDSGECENDCYDALPQVLCERRKQKGYCSIEGWKDYLQRNCAYTCRFCGDRDQGMVARMFKEYY